MNASWALISLTELIAAVGRPDVELDFEDAVRRVAETLDAELAVACAGEEVELALGFGAHRPDDEQIRDLASSAATRATFPGIGDVFMTRTDLEGTDRSVLLGRMSQDFTADERAFMRATGRLLGLASQMRSALTRERQRAQHDPLTGLPNREAVGSQLEARIRRVGEAPVTVLFVDLDRFKQTNDSLGHAFGDLVLTVVGDRLRETVRATDVVGRLSGDEFIVICEGVTEMGAIELAERIQAALRRPIERGDDEFVVTASVGIARARRNDSAEQLIVNADLAMYRAKENGRARIEVFDQEMRARLEQRVMVDQELRRALDADHLEIHLQPVVELRGQRVVGYEALVRWQHPERGLVPPKDFIPIAEETGLITAVDRHVADKTLALLSETEPHSSVSVNLSSRSLTDQSMVVWLEQALRRHGVDPGRLTIEATETALMQHANTAAAQIKAISELGVRVVIDDFGTGYSSLSHLQSFEIDGVKIDRTFVAVLCEDIRASAIVSAVLHMAEALGLEVIAEGIEDPQQVERLLALADRFGTVRLLGQGYLFGRPAPVGEVWPTTRSADLPAVGALGPHQA